MTFADVKKAVPQIKELKTYDFGYSYVFLVDSETKQVVAREPIFVKNLGSLAVELAFVNGSLVSITSLNPRWVAGLDIDAYRNKVEETFKLPQKMKEDTKSSDYYSLACDGFKTKVGEKSLYLDIKKPPSLYWFNSVEDTAAIEELENQRKQIEIDREEIRKE